MAVRFINITRDKFLKDYKRVYRFTNLERFIEGLNSKTFTFINPTKWADPFEKFFLERDFQIGATTVNLPAKDKIYSVCVSGTLSSEAYWKVYAPKEDGVRLTFETDKLLGLFLDNITNADVYIGKVNYQTTKEFYKISFDTKALIKEIEEKKIGDQQIRLLLKKRKSFLYEDEIRILIVPHSKQKDHGIFKVETDITQFTTDYTVDPRLGKNQVKVLRKYFQQEFGFKISHSRLYSDIKREKIILKK